MPRRCRPARWCIGRPRSRPWCWRTSTCSGYLASRPQSCLRCPSRSRRTIQARAPTPAQDSRMDAIVRVVTIEREFASGGAHIAKLLAERLGWKLWDQLLTSEIARLTRWDHSEVARRAERMDPLYYLLLKSFLRGSFQGSLDVHRLK